MTGPVHELREPSARVLITCATFEPGFRGGGPIRSVAQIVDTAPEHLDVLLVTADRDLGSREPYPDLSGRWVLRGKVPVFYANTRNRAQLWRLARDLRKRRIALMYLNSLWEPRFSLLPLVLVLLRVLPVRQVLIAPRGELSPGALALKARKKRYSLWFYKLVLRALKVTWHATADIEAQHIKAVFPHARVILRPNQAGLSSYEAALPRSAGRSKFIHVGRISPKKNLALTMEALAFVSEPLTFDIYGPIEDKAYWSDCQRKIGLLPPHITVSYCGEIQPADVVKTFARYDAFVFPTAGENFGHVIAESLAAACPVICSEETPWTPVLEAGGGEVVRALTPQRLGAVLNIWAARSEAEISQARGAARLAFRRWADVQSQSNILEAILPRADSGT
jgi:glycosyltransferase involved in cell wall biosynthesis